MPVLKLEGVTKDYALGETTVRALRGLDLEVEKGEILAIMGPSGSGKSTLMHILGLLDTPTAGEASIEGTSVETLSERQLPGLRGQKIGFVFQTFNLVETLTAQGNVELPMIFQGVKRDERSRRAAELLTKVGLPDRLLHRPSQLSGGERQRVAIARALANNPEIILADEPTGNLDSETGKKILEILERLAREDGKTVILVTHNPDAAAIANRVVTLKDGRVVDEKRHA
ncbi:MAG: ABC transporter ATP-binding protein [Candidatus Bipolaricaulota bacterium]|jgi:putative ABC transport system ATP-binding protein|nr:ABC transporter ATP-binding protein [Candidatus Bipolaricaulota bacterium]